MPTTLLETESTPGEAEGAAPGGWQGEPLPPLADGVLDLVTLALLNRRIYTDGTDDVGAPYPDGRAECVLGETPNIFAEFFAAGQSLAIFGTPTVQVFRLDGSTPAPYTLPQNVQAVDTGIQPTIRALAQVDTSAFSEGFHFVCLSVQIGNPNTQVETHVLKLLLNVKALVPGTSSESSSGTTSGAMLTLFEKFLRRS